MKLLFLLLLTAGTACAQSSARFTLTRNVLAGGGATTNASSRFQLAGTVGQPLAATPGGGRFSLQGGFWVRPAPILFGPAATGTNFLISIQSEPGETYTVQYQNTLGSGWQSLPPVTGTGGVITVTNGGAGVAQRFFRLRQQ
jgi:hypothetical protein